MMGSHEFFGQIPYGTRDFLPRDAKRKRVIEQSLSRLFEGWGYEEVVAPTYEYIETFASYTPTSGFDTVFKFLDKNNHTLVLRPDMTAPIARITASRLKDAELPLRLSYIANVFRYEQAQAGRQCEFYQGGVELIGSPGPSADAEVVALAIESLRTVGLKNFKLSLGEISFIQGVMEELGLEEHARNEIKHMMLSRNVVGLEACLSEYHVAPSGQQLIKRIHQWYGGPEVLLEVKKMIANSKSRQALDNLLDVYERLRCYDAQEFIAFDLGLIRDFDYYTGMVFEGYTPGLGFPVLGGGRYDKLVTAFGKDCPATGFATGIERMMLAQEKQQTDISDEKDITFVAWDADSEMRAAEHAHILRKKGERVLVALAPMSCEEAEIYVKRRGCKRFIYIK